MRLKFGRVAWVQHALTARPSVGQQHVRSEQQQQQHQQQQRRRQAAEDAQRQPQAAEDAQQQQQQQQVRQQQAPLPPSQQQQQQQQQVRQQQAPLPPSQQQQQQQQQQEEARLEAAYFTFAQLCGPHGLRRGVDAGGPLSAVDALALADSGLAEVFLEGVPALGPDRRDEARRLVTLVDVLYDRGVAREIPLPWQPWRHRRGSRPPQELGWGVRRGVQDTWPGCVRIRAPRLQPYPAHPLLYPNRNAVHLSCEAPPEELFHPLLVAALARGVDPNLGRAAPLPLERLRPGAVASDAVRGESARLGSGGGRAGGAGEPSAVGAPRGRDWGAADADGEQQRVGSYAEPALLVEEVLACTRAASRLGQMARASGDLEAAG